MQEGFTPLLRACGKQDVEAVRKLLASGASVGATNKVRGVFERVGLPCCPSRAHQQATC